MNYWFENDDPTGKPLGDGNMLQYLRECILALNERYEAIWGPLVGTPWDYWCGPFSELTGWSTSKAPSKEDLSGLPMNPIKSFEHDEEHYTLQCQASNINILRRAIGTMIEKNEVDYLYNAGESAQTFGYLDYNYERFGENGIVDLLHQLSYVDGWYTDKTRCKVSNYELWRQIHAAIENMRYWQAFLGIQRESATSMNWYGIGKDLHFWTKATVSAWGYFILASGSNPVDGGGRWLQVQYMDDSYGPRIQIPNNTFSYNLIEVDGPQYLASTIAAFGHKPLVKLIPEGTLSNRAKERITVSHQISSLPYSYPVRKKLTKLDLREYFTWPVVDDPS